MATPEHRGDRSPARDKTAFDCPVCGAFAQQHWQEMVEWNEELGTLPFWDGPRPAELAESRMPWLGNIFEHHQEPSPEELAGEADAGEDELPPALWAFARCARCSFVTIWRGDLLVYPATSRMPLARTDMPAAARALYEEARAVYEVSPRAGAALARAALERLLREVDPDAPARSNLEARIQRVSGEVSLPLARMLTVIRHVGNQSLHVKDDVDEVTVLVLSQEQADIAAMLFEAINELADELITKPAERDALFGLVPESVRERIEKEQASGTAESS